MANQSKWSGLAKMSFVQFAFPLQGIEPLLRRFLFVRDRISWPLLRALDGPFIRRIQQHLINGQVFDVVGAHAPTARHSRQRQSPEEIVPVPSESFLGSAAGSVAAELSEFFTACGIWSNVPA